MRAVWFGATTGHRLPLFALVRLDGVWGAGARHWFYLPSAAGVLYMLLWF